MVFWRKKWEPKGSHCYVTGGSAGLGLALALQLVRCGAHVTIVARDESRLADALGQLEAARTSPSQVLQSFSSDLVAAKASEKALRDACEAHGGSPPDAVFACAGFWRPGYYVEASEEELTRGMEGGFWVQAWTAYAAARMMAKKEKKGKIVLVSSTLGYISFVGWAAYSPAKHALRGLADALQSELQLYGIDVHLFSPPTMYTPGYANEAATKPKMTAEIESTDEGITAEAAAAGLLKGVQAGHMHITADLITSLFRASTRGSVLSNNWFVDAVFDMITLFATPIWRWQTDKLILSHKQSHQQYLQERGYFSATKTRD